MKKTTTKHAPHSTRKAHSCCGSGKGGKSKWDCSDGGCGDGKCGGSEDGTCACAKGEPCNCAKDGDTEGCGPDCACHTDDATGYYARIRAYNPKDYRALRQVWKLSQIGTDETDSAATLGRSGRKGFRVLIAEVELDPRGARKPRVVGGVVLTFDGHRAWVHHLAVHPEFRRLGLGRALLDACEQQAQGWGARHLRLLVRTGAKTAAARRLYADAGWRAATGIEYYRKTLDRA